MKTTLRLLQISDLHLGQPQSMKDRVERIVRLGSPFCRPASRALARATARAVYEMQRTFDAVLITGDLAISGLRPDLKAAREFVDSAPDDVHPWRDRRHFPTLASVPLPIFLMPGNHDRYHDGRGKPGGQNFDSIFFHYWQAGQGVQVFDDIKNSLAIVACDLTLAADEPLFWERPGKGRAYPDRLERLRQETDRLRRERPEHAVLWAIHFPPRFLAACDGLSWVQRKELELLELMDDDLLVRAARDAGVSYILCGHTHWPKHYPIDEEAGIYVHCAGSATQEHPNPEIFNTLHLIEIDVEDGRIVRFDPRELTYRPGRDRFV